VSYVVSVVSLFFIRTQFQGERTAAQRNLRAEIVEGVTWLWRQPLIRFMAFLTGGLNFVNTGSFLVIIVPAQRLGASAADIGFMFSIASAGGIVGSLIGGQIQRRFTFGQVIITVVWIDVLLFPLFAVAPHFLLLGVIAAVSFLTS